MLENTGALKIYPSGFMGSATQPQTSPVDLIALSRQLAQSGMAKKQSQYTANLNVVDLDLGSVSHTEESRSFEYCEKVLKVALVAFGTNAVLPWIEAQTQSTEYGDNHRKFIDETLTFVFTGTGRRLSTHSWKSILRVGDNVLTNRNTSKTVDHFLKGLNNPGMLNAGSLPVIGPKNQPGLTFKELIAMWVTQPGGIRDLQASLSVLFGDR